MGESCRVGDGGVRQEVQGEAGAGIVNVDDDGPRGVQDGSAHALMRVVLAAVFDGVHEQFAEGGGNVFADLRRKVGGDLAQEMSGAVGGIDLAAHVQRDPFGAGGDYADIVLPGVAIERLLDQFAERAGGQGPVEIAEGALADGGEDALRVELSGEDDLGGGTDGTYAPQ